MEHMGEWFAALTWLHLGMVAQLAILEGLLSFDNALALAALVSDRLKNPTDRKHALLWGIWGAYLMRIIIVFVGVWLMEHSWVRLLAGAYLIWMAVNELFIKSEAKQHHPQQEAHAFHLPREHDHHNIPSAGLRALWQTILAVELMDLMFSIDSVAVALAISKEKWILISGAVLGILMMRIAASYFIKLIEKFPILIKTAFVLVGIAGVKVVAEVPALDIGNFHMPWLGLHIPEIIFLPAMFLILIGAMVYNARNPERFKAS